MFGGVTNSVVAFGFFYKFKVDLESGSLYTLLQCLVISSISQIQDGSMKILKI